MFAQITKTQRGFTLIELLVVIAIIGILSSVVLASLNSARQKGRDARRISDIKQLQLALELNFDVTQSYPATAGGGGAASTTLTDLVAANYISSIPSDPSQTLTNGYYYASANNDGTACNTPGPCTSYILRAMVEGNRPAGGYTASGALDCTDSKAYCMRP